VTRLIAITSLILTAILFASGYVVVFVTSMIAIWFDLPGPYSDKPIAWLWLVLNVLMLFIISFVFCRWFARRVEKRSDSSGSSK
jgi:membrane protein implicated in regulation of membrane protease activity